MESCVFQKFLSQQKPPKKQHEGAVTESLESGLSAAAAMQQKVEKEKKQVQGTGRGGRGSSGGGEGGCGVPGAPPPTLQHYTLPAALYNNVLHTLSGMGHRGNS